MKKLFCACIAGALAASGAAQAAYVDFVAAAAGDERGVADGTILNFGSLGVTFSAGGAESQFAYFDDLFEGRAGGLGVCATLVGPAPADCALSSDDNIGASESLALAFSAPVRLSNFSFTDADHFSLNTSPGTLLINGVSFTFADVVAYTPAVAAVLGHMTSVTFAFGGPNALPFYINGFDAEMPIPGAGFLLLAGIAGLGFAARRKKQD
jgi:hypothetical protein